ncbi:MAG TPA: hypothetical protein VK808_01270 [Bacteroidia bacterium]|jgi:hypothetical protein|nr:hypothetical protein [Bacteroidia bacterium]
MASLRKYIFVFLFGCLFLPLIQSHLNLFKLTKLSGAYILSDDTTFTMDGWFSGKYQAHKERYLRDTFGLRSFFIRMHNQIAYSLFKKVTAADITFGKNGRLYNTNYLDAYSGKDFVGSQSIDVIMDKLKKVQDRLQEKNKTFLLVFAPSKDFYDPEFIPEGYDKNDSNNYAICLKIAKKKGINYIDFNGYFSSIRQRSKYPIYSTYGSHWSAYGACLAGDSIINRLEALRNTKILHSIWNNNIVNEEANGDELELENELNLLFSFKHENMAHPKITNPPDSTKTKPNILIIGDSYIWGLGMHYNFFENFSTFIFCYYFKTIYISGHTGAISTAEFNLKDALDKTDIVLIEATVPGLRTFTWGFDEAAREALQNDDELVEFKKKVSAMRIELKNSADAMKLIVEKAKKNNISVDSMLTNDAIWMVKYSKK